MEPVRPDAAVAHASPFSFRRVLFYLICCVLPIAALGFELLTHGSLEVYFDPIPTWLHVLLVASVPGAVVLADVQLQRGRPTRAGCAAAGFAAGVSLVYTLLFLPILPLAALGVIWFGIGLLPFAPVGGLIGSLRRGLRLARLLPSGRRLFFGAAAAGVAVLGLLEVPGWIVTRGLETESVALLERWAMRGTLLRAATLGTSEATLSAHLWHPMHPFARFDDRDGDLRRNQTLFYRVTGEDAGALGSPALPGFDEPQLFGMRRPRLWTDGEASGLSLASSRIDVTAFGDEGIGYLEWTLVFQNDESFPQEATATLRLPPGGVVTRANLWIDGEEREASFGPRGQVRAAYEAVVNTRRDPLLVTSDRPGEAAIRAFPIPANGGTMRIRVGVSAPLGLAAPERAELVLPVVRDRNFTMAPSLAHALWVDSRTPIVEAPPTLALSSEPHGGATARGTLKLDEGERAVVVSRRAGATPLFVGDDTPGATGVIRQHAALRPKASRSWIVVVDGSLGAARERERIAEALGRFSSEHLAGLVVAAAEPLWLIDGPGVDRGKALDRLRTLPFRGGRDNQPALEAAWERAFEQDAAVLWLCAAQPMLLRPADSLVQRIERRPELAIVVLPLEPARNALLDALPARGAVEVRRLAARDAGLLDFANGGPPGWSFVRERVASAPAGARLLGAEHPAAVHVRRLWASDEVQRRMERGPAGDTEAAALAARYRVVTRLSGAVVLETDAQYRAAGLEVPEGPGVDGVPVPEPSGFLLFGAGLVLLEACRRRGRPRKPVA